jgi:hypothetical protein
MGPRNAAIVNQILQPIKAQVFEQGWIRLREVFAKGSGANVIIRREAEFFGRWRKEAR